MNYKSNKNQENKDYEMLEKTELDVNFYENKNNREGTKGNRIN